jgi:branched-chain amino acid transport system permease protein
LGITVEYQRLLIIGVVIAVMAILWLFLSKTKLGIAIRATANDAEVANLMGISVSKTLLMTMGIGTALAAIAAALMAPLWVFYPYAWMAPLTMILAIVVLGGLGSLKGSIIGAFIIALVETLVVFLIPEYGYLRTVIALLAMIIVLSVRPGGLFGIVFEEEKL